MGPTVKIGYLPQIIHFDHPERNLVDTMIYELDCTAQTARNRLAAFKFRGEDVFKPVSALSGGEQSRLRLCMLMDEQDQSADPGRAHQPPGHPEPGVDRGGGGGVRGQPALCLPRPLLHRPLCHPDLDAGGRAHHRLPGHLSGVSGPPGSGRSSAQAAPPAAAAPEEPKKEKPKRPGGTKELEKQVAAAERAVAKAEEQMYELALQIEEAASDYLKLQELYEQREALEEEIAEAVRDLGDACRRSWRRPEDEDGRSVPVIRAGSSVSGRSCCSRRCWPGP